MKKSEKLFKELINENYIDLKPINKIEATPKTTFENKFAEFLAEEAKVEEKKVTKEVEEVAEHNFDYKDTKNLDNQNGQEVMNGVYFEAKQNPDKSIEEIKEIVSKNLDKDSQYYLKNAGGTKDNGWLRKVYVVHANGSASASGSFLGIRNYPNVLPGSKIIIPEKPERKGASTGEIVGIASILTSLAGVLFAAFR